MFKSLIQGQNMQHILLFKPILWSLVKVTDSSGWPYTSKKVALSGIEKSLDDIIC